MTPGESWLHKGIEKGGELHACRSESQGYSTDHMCPSKSVNLLGSRK